MRLCDSLDQTIGAAFQGLLLLLVCTALVLLWRIWRTR